MNVFESIMLVCFGFAWPVSIYKSYVSRKTAGKSLLFLIVLQICYVAGILFKLPEFLACIKSNPETTMNINLYLYVLNFVLITIDECLFLRNRKLEAENKE
jgi:Na+-driven multidrug efflux pump